MPFEVGYTKLHLLQTDVMPRVAHPGQINVPSKHGSKCFQ